MNRPKTSKLSSLFVLTSTFSLMLLTGCGGGGGGGGDTTNPNQRGFEVKFLVGSDLKAFCNQNAKRFNDQNPKLDNGKEFYVTCDAKGSGDVVTQVVSLAQQLKQGTIQPDDPQFPTLISVDGEIYYAQLIYRVDQIFPGQNYIPPITDSPLLVNSPMVFMVPTDVAKGIRKQQDLYRTLVKAKNHKELDPSSPSLPLYFVHTAPTRSNSGLQTLVAQFASVSGKPPEQLTVADVKKYQPQIQQIQSKVTRYGVSSRSLTESMVTNGPFWASIASTYESLVIEANLKQQGTQASYVAIYPKATFTSNMRAILPNAPWVSDDERAAAEQVIEFFRSPESQKIATDLGLRPGVPGIALGSKFSPQYGVDPQAKYDSLRVPKPQVVEAMLKSWQQFAKKPSQVVIVVDSSGSMSGNKLPAVQNTLRTYINSLGPKEKIALIDFDSEIRAPVIVDGTPQGKDRGMQFIANLQANGGTRLYDAALQGREWLRKNLRPDAINAVIILTDGQDSGSQIKLNQLNQQLKKTGFESAQRIAFFTIGYGDEGDFNPDVLKQIAKSNAGYYRKGDPATIANLMADLQLEF
jgi:Ca-activated chloride channel family protein